MKISTTTNGGFEYHTPITANLQDVDFTNITNCLIKNTTPLNIKKYGRYTLAIQFGYNEYSRRIKKKTLHGGINPRTKSIASLEPKGGGISRVKRSINNDRHSVHKQKQLTTWLDNTVDSIKSTLSAHKQDRKYPEYFTGGLMHSSSREYLENAVVFGYMVDEQLHVQVFIGDVYYKLEPTFANISQVLRYDETYSSEVNDCLFDDGIISDTEADEIPVESTIEISNQVEPSEVDTELDKMLAGLGDEMNKIYQQEDIKQWKHEQQLKAKH